MTTIHVTATREYDVLVQPGLLDDAGAQIARTSTSYSREAVTWMVVIGRPPPPCAAAPRRAGA